MTELERARAHLRECQEALANARRIGWLGHVMQWREQTVLAALSWVWEAQTNEALHEAEEWCPGSFSECELHETFGRDVAHYALSS